MGVHIAYRRRRGSAEKNKTKRYPESGLSSIQRELPEYDLLPRHI